MEELNLPMILVMKAGLEALKDRQLFCDRCGVKSLCRQGEGMLCTKANEWLDKQTKKWL